MTSVKSRLLLLVAMLTTTTTNEVEGRDGATTRLPRSTNKNVNNRAMLADRATATAPPLHLALRSWA